MNRPPARLEAARDPGQGCRTRSSILIEMVGLDIGLLADAGDLDAPGKPPHRDPRLLDPVREVVAGQVDERDHVRAAVRHVVDRRLRPPKRHVAEEDRGRVDGHLVLVEVGGWARDLDGDRRHHDRGVGRHEIETDPGLPRGHSDRVRLAVDPFGKHEHHFQFMSSARCEVGDVGVIDEGGDRQAGKIGEGGGKQEFHLGGDDVDGIGGLHAVGQINDDRNPSTLQRLDRDPGRLGIRGQHGHRDLVRVEERLAERQEIDLVFARRGGYSKGADGDLQRFPEAGGDRVDLASRTSDLETDRGELFGGDANRIPRLAGETKIGEGRDLLPGLARRPDPDEDGDQGDRHQIGDALASGLHVCHVRRSPLSRSAPSFHGRRRNAA